MEGAKSIARNRVAEHDFELTDEWVAGIVLEGDEVKSLRLNGRANLAGTHVFADSSGLVLRGAYIAPFQNGGRAEDETTRRDRRLLLNAREITAIAEVIGQKGMSVIPTEFFWRNGRIKVRLRSGRGRKQQDKRQVLRERAQAMDAAREMKA